MESVDARLIRLRVELFTAPQILKGDDLEEFWKLIDEVRSIRVLHPPPSEQKGGE